MRIVEKICNKVAVLNGGNLAESGLVKQVFYNPQTATAKSLLFPSLKRENFTGSKKLRLVFDGESYDKPLISSMVLDCQVMVNILFANTKTLDGKTFGQMIIEIPNSESSQSKICGYLQQHSVNFNEIENE